MSDYLAAIAQHLDREPDACTCCSTDRGTDTLGCEQHDPPPARDGSGPAARGSD